MGDRVQNFSLFFLPYPLFISSCASFATLIISSPSQALSAPINTDDAILKMEQQIHKMQAQLAAMKHKQMLENRQIRAELARQRHIIEQDPYRFRASLLANQTNSYPPSDSDSFTLHFRPKKYSNSQQENPYNLISGTPNTYTNLYGQLHNGQLQIGGIRITLGGYFEAASIWRSRNTGSDIATAFNNIPWGNNPQHHLSEFRETERQSRFSSLIEGKLTQNLEADGYVETDFQSSGSSSNSRQSSSYTLRVRSLYGELKDYDDGWYLLGGQTWSLITLFNHSMMARNEQTPLSIDAQYVPGFNWIRTTQIRIVKTFGEKEHYALGLSLENPSATIAGKPYTPNQTTITDRITGANINNPNTYYSTDPAPDIIIKAAADPGWGHYELTGITRFFRDRTSTLGDGHNHTTLAGGGGGGFILPFFHHKLNIQASGLVGRGIGRFGSTSMPDFTYKYSGAPQSLPEANFLIGIYGTPIPALTLYSYIGAEKILKREGFSVDHLAYGYGSADNDMSGCSTELSNNCNAANNIRLNAQATAGFWYVAAKGSYGTLRVGGQYAHSYLKAFSAISGSPHTDDDMVFMSLRYMPFN